MNSVAFSIKQIRRSLSLEPRQNLISELEARLKKIEAEEAPDYAVLYLTRGISDLRAAESEEILINKLVNWVTEANGEKDLDKRSVIAQIAAFIMSTKY